MIRVKYPQRHLQSVRNTAQKNINAEVQAARKRGVLHNVVWNLCTMAVASYAPGVCQGDPVSHRRPYWPQWESSQTGVWRAGMLSNPTCTGPRGRMRLVVPRDLSGGSDTCPICSPLWWQMPLPEYDGDSPDPRRKPLDGLLASILLPLSTQYYPPWKLSPFSLRCECWSIGVALLPRECPLPRISWRSLSWSLCTLWGHPFTRCLLDSWVEAQCEQLTLDATIGMLRRRYKRTLKSKDWKQDFGEVGRTWILAAPSSDAEWILKTTALAYDERLSKSCPRRITEASLPWAWGRQSVEWVCAFFYVSRGYSSRCGCRFFRSESSTCLCHSPWLCRMYPTRQHEEPTIGTRTGLWGMVSHFC